MRGGGVPAGAGVGVDVVPAGGSVLAGAGETLGHIPAAVLAAEAGHAEALGDGRVKLRIKLDKFLVCKRKHNKY